MCFDDWVCACMFCFRLCASVYVYMYVCVYVRRYVVCAVSSFLYNQSVFVCVTVGVVSLFCVSLMLMSFVDLSANNTCVIIDGFIVCIKLVKRLNPFVHFRFIFYHHCMCISLYLYAACVSFSLLMSLCLFVYTAGCLSCLYPLTLNACMKTQIYICQLMFLVLIPVKCI